MTGKAAPAGDFPQPRYSLPGWRFWGFRQTGAACLTTYIMALRAEDYAATAFLLAMFVGCLAYYVVG